MVGTGHIQRKNLLQDGGAVLALLEIHLDGSNALRVCSGGERFEYPASSGFYYFPRIISLTTLRQSSSGLPSPVRVRSVGHDKRLVKLVETYGPFQGKAAILRIVHELEADEAGYDEIPLEIAGSSSTLEVTEWSLGFHSDLGRDFPRLSSNRDGCEWGYRDPDT